MKPRIAFVSEHSPEDRRASSGTNFKMASNLAQIGELHWVHIRKRRVIKLLFLFIRKAAALFGKRVMPEFTLIGSKMLYSIHNRQELKDCDLVAAFFCMPVLAHIKTDKPIIYFTDATFPAMVGYYFHHLPQFNIIQGTALEKRAMYKSSAVILASRWAAKSATEDIGLPREKIHIVEFGANIDKNDIQSIANLKHIPDTLNDKSKEDALNHDLQNEPIEILFLGVDWERKGGDIAIDAVRWLNENGIKARLHIAGIRNLDRKIENLYFVKNHGFFKQKQS